MTFSVGDTVEVIWTGCNYMGQQFKVIKAESGWVRFATPSGFTHSHLENCFKLIKQKGSFMGTLVEKAKFLALSADDKVLRKQGVTGADGKLTAEGRELLEQVNLTANKAELVKLAKAIEISEKEEKKS